MVLKVQGLGLRSEANISQLLEISNRIGGTQASSFVFWEGGLEGLGMKVYETPNS